MANKAILGAMALGIGGYTATEAIKDWQAEREKKNSEQALRDREAEMERRFEEKLRKEGNKSVKNKSRSMLGEAASDLLYEKEFQMKVYSHLEEMLFGLCSKVGERGEYKNNLHMMLNLPLMSDNEYDKEDLMLAAALALGDSDVVNRVMECFEKQRLGIGLKKFLARRLIVYVVMR
jgi:hypothetical protein